MLDLAVVLSCRGQGVLLGAHAQGGPGEVTGQEIGVLLGIGIVQARLDPVERLGEALVVQNRVGRGRPIGRRLRREIL